MFEYTFMQNAFIVSLLISLLCPLIGIFSCPAPLFHDWGCVEPCFPCGGSHGPSLKSTPIMGAFWMTSFFGLLIEALRERFRRYAELTLVIVMSFSVGLAITLVSSGLVKANIDSFLFGSILTVGREEVYLVGALTFVSVLAVWGLYPQLVMLSFDEDGARISGVPRRAINYVFSLLVAATISVSIRIVGILVISSLIALPVATALQLRQGFNRTLLLSVLFSFIDIMGGLVISYELGAAPGGITAILSVILLVAVLIYQEIQDHLQGGERR